MVSNTDREQSHNEGDHVSESSIRLPTETASHKEEPEEEHFQYSYADDHLTLSAAGTFHCNKYAHSSDEETVATSVCFPKSGNGDNCKIEKGSIEVSSKIEKCYIRCRT